MLVSTTVLPVTVTMSWYVTLELCDVVLLLNVQRYILQNKPGFLYVLIEKISKPFKINAQVSGMYSLSAWSTEVQYEWCLANA